MQLPEFSKVRFWGFISRLYIFFNSSAAYISDRSLLILYYRSNCITTRWYYIYIPHRRYAVACAWEFDFSKNAVCVLLKSIPIALEMKEREAFDSHARHYYSRFFTTMMPRTPPRSRSTRQLMLCHMHLCYSWRRGIPAFFLMLARKQ